MVRIACIGRKYRIYFTAEDEFFRKEISVDFKFEKNEEGTIAGFYFLNNGKKQLVKKL
jgi:hypothetical protein